MDELADDISYDKALSRYVTQVQDITHEMREVVLGMRALMQEFASCLRSRDHAGREECQARVDALVAAHSISNRASMLQVPPAFRGHVLDDLVEMGLHFDRALQLIQRGFRDLDPDALSSAEQELREAQRLAEAAKEKADRLRSVI